MKTILLLCALAFGGYECWSYYQSNDPMPPAPQVDEPKTVSAIPAPTPRGPVSPVDVIGSAWKEKEVGDWQGTWTRRGFTNIFDAKIHSGEAGMTKTFVAVITRDANSVRVDSYQASDGRNCIYDGILSADGTKITGTYTWSTNRDSFAVDIVPVVRTARSFAPDGTFFLLSYRSVKTDRGITGFPPGTQVTAVKDFGTIMSVRSGGYDFQVSKNELTNDVDLANDLANEDASEQSTLSAKAIADTNTLVKGKVDQLKVEADAIQRLSVAQASASRISSTSNPLNRGAYGQTNKSADWQITKEQSMAILNYVLTRDENAQNTHSIDLAPLPILHSAMDVNRARNFIQDETKRTDISRGEYKQLTERLHQLNFMGVGGPEVIANSYQGYEQ